MAVGTISIFAVFSVMAGIGAEAVSVTFVSVVAGGEAICDSIWMLLLLQVCKWSFASGKIRNGELDSRCCDSRKARVANDVGGYRDRLN